MTMPFGDQDVAAVADDLESRSRIVRWAAGITKHGVADLLRGLWQRDVVIDKALRDAETKEANLLTDLHRALRERSIAIHEKEALLRRFRKSVSFLIEEALIRHRGNGTEIIVLSPTQMAYLADERHPDNRKAKALTGERWAYTFNGHRVYTMKGVTGPLIMDQAAFATLYAHRSDLTIREM